MIDRLYESPEAFVGALLRSLSAKGLRLVIVLDNTDQQGGAFQERVFLFAQKLSQEHKALCIVALREERFFAAYRRGIFDAFGDRRFHVGSPELRLVLKERLSYGRQRFRHVAENGSLAVEANELEQIDRLLACLVHSVTHRNQNIVRMLSCVSNGDMRHALGMFREFVSSGNTNIQKILNFIDRGEQYSVPFHEFAKSAILGSRRFFKSGSSHVVNIFKKSAARKASHLTGLRILARLSRAEETASAHGDGFVKTTTLLGEYRGSFGVAEDFEQVASEFIRRGLIESEPPKVQEVAASVALRVSAAGSYYWRYLARAFAYIDLVWIDTPISNQHLAKELAGMADAYSGPSRPLIPFEGGHPFRWKPATDSVAKRPPIPLGSRPLFGGPAESAAGIKRNAL